MATSAEKTKEVIALFPASFDPIHLGHISLAERAARLVDKLYMGIAINPAKKGRFSVEEKKEFIEASVGHIPNYSGVISFDEGLTVDHARDLGASMMLRGVRSVDDFLFESKLANQNVYAQESIGIEADSDNYVETVTLHTTTDFEHVESSLVRGFMDLGGVQSRIERIQPLVATPVFDAIVANHLGE